MNNRERMRASNRLALDYLIKHFGWRDITLRTHCKHHDYVHNKDKTYEAMDYWNLFDGMGFDGAGRLTFLQIKTGKFAPEQPILDFVKRNKIRVTSVNVKKVNNRYEVLLRHYN